MAEHTHNKKQQQSYAICTGKVKLDETVWHKNNES